MQLHQGNISRPRRRYAELLPLQFRDDQQLVLLRVQLPRESFSFFTHIDFIVDDAINIEIEEDSSLEAIHKIPNSIRSVIEYAEIDEVVRLSIGSEKPPDHCSCFRSLNPEHVVDLVQEHMSTSSEQI